MIDIPTEVIDKIIKHYEIRGHSISREKVENIIQSLAKFHPNYTLEQFVADIHEMLEWDTMN